MRNENKQIVDEIKAWCDKSTLMVVAAYHGLNAAKMTTLRNRVAEQHGQAHVVKNRLLKRALPPAAGSAFGELLAGPNALITTTGNAVALAKVLAQFAKEHEALAIRGGLLDQAQVLSADSIRALAALPSREVLLARIMGALQGPVRGVASCLQTVIAGMARALDQIAKKKGTETPAAA